jgi:hypothetical protein
MPHADYKATGRQRVAGEGPAGVRDNRNGEALDHIGRGFMSCRKQ